MDQEKLWATFQKTGKVEDYLRYCGIDVYTNTVAEEHNGEPVHEDNHRRTDHSGKQQYR
ncbi:MAG: hypothetical protein IKB04_08305 [Clostridia bacterium]|nr:hypothetical protein [Clostridia bacterium]